MSSSSRAEPLAATVVALDGVRPRTRRSLPRPSGQTAQLLSIRRYLAYQATVEIDNLATLTERFGRSCTDHLVRDIRALLDHEFGSLRIHRYRGVYRIRHRSVEGIIAGLLRVQFHAQNLLLPTTDRHGAAVDTRSIKLTWGVGRSAGEADLERMRRRHLKRR